MRNRVGVWALVLIAAGVAVCLILFPDLLRRRKAYRWTPKEYQLHVTAGALQTYWEQTGTLPENLDPADSQWRSLLPDLRPPAGIIYFKRPIRVKGSSQPVVLYMDTEERAVWNCILVDAEWPKGDFYFGRTSRAELEAATNASPP